MAINPNINWDQFKWDLFTVEERQRMRKQIDLGNFSNLAAIIEFDDVQKERELRKILSVVAPVEKGFDSSVAKELENVEIETPEQEAAWQAKLDEERKRFQEHRLKLEQKYQKETEKELAAIAEAQEKLDDRKAAVLNPQPAEVIEKDEPALKPKQEVSEAKSRRGRPKKVVVE